MFPCRPAGGEIPSNGGWLFSRKLCGVPVIEERPLVDQPLCREVDLLQTSPGEMSLDEFRVALGHIPRQ